jgi:two-component system invasion response regulator UvrY
MKKITILIVDDHILIREAWRQLLNGDPRYTVVGDCSSGEAAFELTGQFHPDIILMDINLQGLGGLEATPVIHKAYPESKIIGLSGYAEVCYVKTMIKAGAMGYVTKSSGAAELFKAIDEVYNNRKYICDEIKNLLCNDITDGKDRKRSGMLSTREFEIIKHLQQGFSSKEIALLLKLSAKTIDMHRNNIRRKLNVKNTAALVNHIKNTF